jgi:hypothetical protein
MIAHFGLDPDILGVCNPDLWEAMDPRERRDVRSGLMRLQREWGDTGVWVYEGKDVAASRVAQSVSGLPADLRKIWQEFLTSNGRFRRVSSPCAEWRGISAEDGVRSLASVAQILDVACISDENAQTKFGVPEEANVAIVSSGGRDVELCRFSCVDQAKAFATARGGLFCYIEQGTRIVDVWRNQFGPLARYSTRCVAVDRYAGSDGPSWDGLCRFLTELDAPAGPGKKRPVTLFIGFQKDPDLAKISNGLAQVRRGLSRGGVGEITLHLIHDGAFGRLSHGRHVRFDERVCEFDAGMSLFAGSQGGHAITFKGCQFTVKPYTREHERVEKALCEATHSDYPQTL